MQNFQSCFKPDIIWFNNQQKFNFCQWILPLVFWMLFDDYQFPTYVSFLKTISSSFLPFAKSNYYFFLFLVFFFWQQFHFFNNFSQSFLVLLVFKMFWQNFNNIYINIKNKKSPNGTAEYWKEIQTKWAN